MGSDCCSQKNHEQSSLGLMNGVSYRKSIQDGKKKISHIKDEEIIEDIREYKENQQNDNKIEQNDHLTKTPLFQMVNSEINIPIIESQVIEQEKIVENNNIIPDRVENEYQKEEKVFENKRESVEKSNFAEIQEIQEIQKIQVEQEIVGSKQIENQIIDKMLTENKLESESLSFSSNFDTVNQQSTSNIEQRLKNKSAPGKLSLIFLRALERKILGIQMQKEEKEEEVIPIIDRPIPKVRPRKIQQFVEL